MAKLFCILLIFMYISITISYNFQDRLVSIIGDEKSAEVLNSTAVSLVDALEFDPCPPVEAVKALGCGLSERYPPFNGLFQPICEQHQLCYACGSALGIPAQQCDQWALIKMYEICFEDEVSAFPSFLRCLKQRVSAMILLRQHFYRSIDVDSEFFSCMSRQMCL